MNPFEPPKTDGSLEPITQTARRIRERRRNEQDGENWGVLVLLVVGGLVAMLFVCRL